MKKLFNLLFVICAVCSLAVLSACGKSKDEGFKPVAKEDIKIGLICLHDESSTYDANFINSMKEALKNLGIPESQLVLWTGIEESEACYTKAVELAASCDVIFADSFGHEDYMIQAAREYPNVHFCHATGEKAHLVNLPNYSNAFASIYEGRYLAGVAAGLKLAEINAGKENPNYKVGYVGAYPYAEVVSGYTAWFLGVQSVCPQATMKVKYTSSWYDFNKEYEAAKNLVEVEGCALISQHADSYGAPQLCEEKGVPNVSYNGSTASQCPNTYIVSSRINWAPYFEYMINQTIKGEAIATDWVGTIQNGAVELCELGTACAAGTAEKLNEVKAALANGTLKVFDLSKFTVGGETLTSCMANVDFDEAYQADHDVKATSGSINYFDESNAEAYRSAPYFEFRIDGVDDK